MNNSILHIHLDVLDKNRRDLLDNLIPLIGGTFILGGGTALALQLKHRKSFDFDFFTASPIPKNLLNKLTKTIPIGNIAVDTSDELTFFTANNIKLTFLHYPFTPHFEHIKLENGLTMYSTPEIALQKAYTI